uniref:Uncharacterized protein n=1 Tax=viral metagenome TaxID=1070528 RepID=A0A6C0IY86_9ZZZZ
MSAYFNKATGFLKSKSDSLVSNNSYLGKTIKAVIAIIVVMFLVYLVKKIAKGYNDYKSSHVMLLNGTKDATKRMVILQDPTKENSKTIIRSKNEEGGLEFSYIFWMYIDDMSYRYGKWKHVMHKGNEEGHPLRAPGVWIHPKDNKLRIFMNTYSKINEYVDVDNIPVRKWFNVAICIKQKIMDIYINGNVVTSKKLSNLPKQNYGDLFINSFQGFSGQLSNMQYYDYYISYSQIRSSMNFGPSMMPLKDMQQQMPPYLTPNWWTNN